MILWLAISVATIVAFLGTALYFLQAKLVFHPSREFVTTPDRHGFSFEETFIQITPGERLHGWFFFGRDADREPDHAVVLFCHGNAGNISHRLETVDLLVHLGADVLLFDYRGYGRSDGSPSEASVYADAEACYHWLTGHKGISPERIVIFGRSLGGAVAADLAGRVGCRSVALESTFTSVADLARCLYPALPLKRLLRYRFDTLSKIRELRCPLLITHSPDDELVPFNMGQRLFAAARQPKRFVKLSGGHNDREYLIRSDYIEALRALLGGRSTNCPPPS